MYAFVGTLIAIIAVILATLLVCVHVYDGITTDNMVRAHRENIAIQTLDAMPFLFAWWGQYASARMASEAGSMVESHTGELQEELANARFTARAKTDFCARMSHELRTPINAIVGMSELVMDADDPEQRRHQAQVIHDSAYGLLSLVNDVLDFSRIEAGRMELDDVGFDLQDHLNGTATLLDQQARAKGLHLTALVPPDAPSRVVGDPGRLRQIVVNLVGNAIKFTDQGEVVLTLKKWLRLEEGGYRIRIEVADTGPASTNRPAPRCSRPTAAATTGTRKGPASACRSRRNSSTRWTARSAWKPNRARAACSGSPPSSAPRAPDRREAMPTLRGRRVLLADPIGERREALAGQLRTLGMWVAQAADGIEAMQIALRGAADGSPYDLLPTDLLPTDLLPTDLFLPHLSGEELGRRLKHREHTRSICLAVLTATGAHGDAKRLNEAGFAGYLTRPVPPERLEELLQAVLSTRDLTEGERRREGLVTRYHAENDAVATNPVLVVDDSPVNLEITLHHLARLGIEADSVGDAGEAIGAVGQRDYGVVLMDLRLPDMSGAEAIRRIRSDGSARKPAMLVLTAGATVDERRACEAAGIESFLTKPIERATLRTALAPHVGLDDPSTAPPAVTPEEAPNPRLARIFLEETGQRIEAMRAALDGPGDAETLGRHAHAIGSGSRHFPGEQLSDRARRIEALADAGDIATTRKALPDFEAAWATMREWLETAAARA